MMGSSPTAQKYMILLTKLEMGAATSVFCAPRDPEVAGLPRFFPSGGEWRA
jgi:hypothetical protein